MVAREVWGCHPDELEAKGVTETMIYEMIALMEIEQDEFSKSRPS